MIIEEENELKPGQYFVKKAFCLVTHQVPSSVELNKINIYLKNACLNLGMHCKFEEYVSRVIFGIPLPERSFAKKIKIHLPPIIPPKIHDNSIKHD